MNIVFFGSSKFVIPIIEVLQKNFDLRLVLTTEDPALSAGKPKIEKPNLASQGLPPSGLSLRVEDLRSWPVVKYCVENKIPYLSVSNLSKHNTKYLILNTRAPIAVLADFGLIIPKEILDAFPKGIINIHPSLLPKYRGPTPVQTAILNGEKVTGVTIIKLDEEIDHGPILTQVKEPILDNDTSESLYERLFRLSTSVIVSTIELYVKGKIMPYKQDRSQATFTKHLSRQDGYIDISKLKTRAAGKASGDARQNSKLIDRMIQAYYPWPSTWTKWKMENGKWKILKFLPNNKLQVEGKKPASYKDFLNGYPKIGKEILTKLGFT